MLKQVFRRQSATVALLGVLLNLLGTAPVALAQISSCSDFQEVKDLQDALPGVGTSRAARAASQDQLWNAWKNTARKIFSRYLRGEMSADSFESCALTSEDREALRDLLPQIFFEESLSLLEKSQSSSIQSFMRILHERTHGNHLVLFRLVGHFRDQVPPTSSLAGVQRGSGSIFMNFAKIPPNEWLVILIHELAHSLDDRLQEAVMKFSDEGLVKELAVFATKSQDPGLLPAELRSRTDRWLMAGLDRGFLAEYRAWTITFQVYQDGLRERLWNPIPWLDSILAIKGPNVPLASFTLHYLDSNFIDPTDGIFSLPLIKRELKNVRNALRNAQEPPPLGNFTQVIF